MWHRRKHGRDLAAGSDNHFDAADETCDDERHRPLPEARWCPEQRLVDPCYGMIGLNREKFAERDSIDMYQRIAEYVECVVKKRLLR